MKHKRFSIRFNRSQPTVYWLIWHVISGLFIVLLPAQLRYGYSLPGYSVGQLFSAAGLLIGYGLVAFLVTRQTRNNRDVKAHELLLDVFGVFGLLILLDGVFGLETSRIVILSLVTGSLASFLAALTLPRHMLVVLALFLSLVTVSMQLLNDKPFHWYAKIMTKTKVTQELKIVNSNLYQMQLRFFDRYFTLCGTDKRDCRNPRNGGAIASLFDGFLVGNGEGDVYFARLSKNFDDLFVETIKVRVPINDDEFVSALEAEGVDVPSSLRLFRVADIAVQEQGRSSFNLCQPPLLEERAELFCLKTLQA